MLPFCHLQILLECGSQMGKGKGKITAFEKLKGLIILVYITIEKNKRRD